MQTSHVAIDAEKTVIGGVLIRPLAFVDVADAVTPADFVTERHRAIFAAFVALDQARKPIDPLTVESQITHDGAADVFDGDASRYLRDVQGEVVTLDNLRHHAEVIAAKAERRRWFQALSELRVTAADEALSEKAFFEQAEQRLLEVTSGRRDGAGPVQHVKPLVKQYTLHLAARQAAKKAGAKTTGIPFGYDAVDELTAGMHPGDLVIVAGRPGMGKTAFTLNVAENSARNGVFNLGFTREMRDLQLIERLMASVAHVDGGRLRRADLEQHHWSALVKATGSVVEWPLYIDAKSATLTQIRSTARRWRMTVAKDKPALVWIDYIGLIESSGKKENRANEVAEISRSLKSMAKELDCPVIALSQLNRGVESRDEKRPKMADLRESGQIEQDADLILFLYRDEVYSKEKCPDELRGKAEIIVAKQRAGSLGTVLMDWHGAYTRFESSRDSYQTADHWERS